jgi:hypothetical protein
MLEPERESSKSPKRERKSETLAFTQRLASFDPSTARKKATGASKRRSA